MFDGSSLIPECYIDTNLIETISFKGCNHQKSCSMVANTMKKKYAERFAVGIIDKDKKLFIVSKSQRENDQTK